MDVNIGTDGIDKIDSEYLKRNMKCFKESEKVPAHPEPDQVELSSRGLDLKEMQMKAMSFPDVRPGKVEQIKMQLDSGLYNISPGEIAERMIEEAMEPNS
jgi:flagellar biosynthesis anti-sigma factor FlgM